MEQTKVCNKCKIEKPISEFHKEKKGKYGVHSTCKKCKNARRKQLHKENAEYEKEYKKRYAIENKDKIKEYYEKVDKERKRQKYFENREEILEKRKKYHAENKDKIHDYQKKRWKKYYAENKHIEQERKKKYYLENKEKFSVWTGNRRAMEEALPHSLTNEQWMEILEECGYECLVTESEENISLEHFIPLCIGHGGTVLENVYPMDLSLNISKNGSNPFEWIKCQEVHIQHNFYHKLVPYMANKNNMTVIDFKAYVNWCFNNKRTIEQIQEDDRKGLSSIDLYKLSQKEGLEVS